jgi:hypothetical protein
MKVESMKNVLKVLWKIIKVLCYIVVFPIIIFYAIVRGFTEDSLKEKDRYKHSDDKLYGLTKYEKEEINKGRYKASQFSESTEGDYLDSDDYYEDE